MLLLSELQDGAGEQLEALHHELPGVSLHQVSIAHDQNNVKGFSWWKKFQIHSESIVELVYAATSKYLDPGESIRLLIYREFIICAIIVKPPLDFFSSLPCSVELYIGWYDGGWGG